MNKRNNQLLEEVIQKRLELALNAEGEMSEAAFEEAMEAIDRQIAIDRVKNESLSNEEEKVKDRRDSMIKCLEIGATIIAAPIITAKINKSFAHMLCEFEKNYNFTTTAGKSLSKIFKLK